MPKSPAKKRILITGASGCVGHYLVDELARGTDHELVLVMRNPAKLKLDPAWQGRITVIEADVKDTDTYLRKLGHIDIAILAAACWGGPDAWPVNVHTNVAIAEHLARSGGQRIYYFGSGSVFDHNRNLLPAAHELGSEYIRSKYELVEAMDAQSDKIDIVGVFPTLILGGGDGKPMSHFANLLCEAARWSWLAGYLRADGRFHYIHARDIARTMRALIDGKRFDDTKPARIVLGNPATTVNGFVDDFVKYRGNRPLFRFTLRDWHANFLIKVFRIQLAPWDRYCMEHRDLSFDRAVNPEDFGEPVFCPDLETGLKSVGIPGRD